MTVENKPEEEVKEKVQETDGPLNDHVRKILTEKKNYQEKTRVLEEEIRKLKEDKMREQQDFKLLAETKELEAQEWKTKYTEKEELIKKSLKLSSVKKEIVKLGCDSKYVDEVTRLINMDQVSYDEETGVCTGAEEQAKILYNKFTPLFGKTVVGVNQDAPAGNLGPLTTEEWSKLPKEERVKRRSELYKNLGVH